MNRPRNRLLSLITTAAIVTTAAAQTNLAIEFNEDDQPGFDLWPAPLGGSYMIAQFGAVTVEVSTNTSFASPTDRGSSNGNPPGYSYQHLYEDLLHAFTPTGTLTMDFSGLLPNEPYIFTLYAWDPGTSSGTHEWTITAGTSVPPAITVDWATPLVDNNTFALVFEVTTTAAGTFQIDNTDGLAGSAVNGFRLTSLSGPIGDSYCGPANLNSSGQFAVISASGNTDVSINSLSLTGAQLPTNQFGYFLNSDTQGFVLPPGSQGNLCVGGAIGRHSAQIGNSGAGGVIEIDVDLTALPRPLGPYVVVPGETWHFQLWFRDANPSPTSNFTDGVTITFE